MTTPDRSARPRPRPSPGGGAARPPVDTPAVVNAPVAPTPPTPPVAPTPPVSRAVRRRPSWFPDAHTWGGALILMLIVGAGFWVVQIVNASEDYRLNRFGLVARERHGLWGVLLQPVLDSSYDHVLQSSIAVVIIGWGVMLSGLRAWSGVTLAVVGVGGLLTWLVAPGGHLLLGAGGLLFGWLGYLIARALFSRRIMYIIVTASMLFVFGALLIGLFPTLKNSGSWQEHVCAFAVGALAGAVLHRRGGLLGGRRRSAVS